MDWLPTPVRRLVILRRLLVLAMLLCLPLLAGARPPDDDNSITRMGRFRAVTAVPPSCATITVTPGGAASSFNALGVAGLTISNVTALSTDLIVVFLGFNNPAEDDGVIPVVTYNGATFELGGVGPTPGLGNYSGEIYVLAQFTGTTADITIDLNNSTVPTAAAATAYVISGLQNDYIDVVDPGVYNASSGLSTTPSVTSPGPTSQACEVLVTMVTTAGPSTDAAGTWGNSFTGVQRVGTTEVTPDFNITVADAYRIVTSVGTYTANKTGITSRAWLAVIAGYKQ